MRSVHADGVLGALRDYAALLVPHAGHSTTTHRLFRGTLVSLTLARLIAPAFCSRVGGVKAVRTPPRSLSELHITLRGSAPGLRPVAAPGSKKADALGAPPEDPNDLYLALLFFRRCCIAECDDDAPERAGFRGDGGVDWPNVYAALRDAATFGAVSTLSRDASALLPMMRHDDPHLASGLNLSFNPLDFNLR